MHTHTHTLSLSLSLSLSHTHMFKSISAYMIYTTYAYIAAAATVVTAGVRGMAKGERRPVFCRLHRKEGHIDVINRRQVCDRGVFCIVHMCFMPAPGGRHGKKGHIDVISRRQVGG